MNKFLNKILLLVVIVFCLTGNSVFSSENVLQAIQINGFKDTYNIILKSDDVAVVKKTVQAPNKIILTLKGIRASKTINTIYNNTSSIDSVIVEPIGDDVVKIFVQGRNVGHAVVHFDSLKIPLNLLGSSQKQAAPIDELTLNGPINSYEPVYHNNLGVSTEKDKSFSAAVVSKSIIKNAKKIFKSQKFSWIMILGLFTIIILNALKTVKGKDGDIKIGLTQSLKDREIDMYSGGVAGVSLGLSGASQNLAGANYGIKAYQSGTRSPYLSSEQRSRSRIVPPSPVNAQPIQQIAKDFGEKSMAYKSKSVMQNPVQKSNSLTALQSERKVSKLKATNIDSIKFLESMTKIYEKNGRADLAQGLKANMKKAKSNLV